MSKAIAQMIDSIITGSDQVPKTVKKEKGEVIRDGRRAKPATKAKKVSKKETDVVATEAVEAAAVETTKGESKAARAKEIVQQLQGVRKDSINAIMEQLGMSQAGATTYFYNAKKALGI